MKRHDSFNTDAVRDTSNGECRAGVRYLPRSVTPDYDIALKSLHALAFTLTDQHVDRNRVPWTEIVDLRFGRLFYQLKRFHGRLNPRCSYLVRVGGQPLNAGTTCGLDCSCIAMRRQIDANAQRFKYTRAETLDADVMHLAGTHTNTFKITVRIINAINGLKSKPPTGGTTERIGARM